MSQNSYLYAFCLVFLAGIFWSFGALTVRYMVDGHQYVFQYLFYRGLTISIILLIYLFFREGFAFYKNLITFREVFFYFQTRLRRLRKSNLG